MATITQRLAQPLASLLGRRSQQPAKGPQTPSVQVQLTAPPVRLTAANTRFIMERIPLRWISQGRITEADLALAATTPVLGQYAPTFGWPDDWGWYWEYLDAYLFVPEAAFAVKLKTREIWKPGFEYETTNDSLNKKLLKEWKKRKIFPALKEATKNTQIWGNTWIESVDNSNAVWLSGEPGDVAQGASYMWASPGSQAGMINPTGAPRPLKSFTKATKFYGLKNTDPRTWRIQVHPQRFDPTPDVPPAPMSGVESDWDEPRSQVRVEKYVQRRWAGPLSPTAVINAETEIDFHPDQILHLAFNKITGGIYGYSTYRESIFALKGYLLMLQYLPTIVGKRADRTLHVKFGGDYFTDTGSKVTDIPTTDEIRNQKEAVQNRMAGEDIYTDVLTTVEEVYKGGGGDQRIDTYLEAYKERVLLGLGIPMAVVTTAGGAEIKWGSLQMDMVEDEIREYQQAIEQLVDDYVTPRLLMNLRPGRQLGDGPEVQSRFATN